jgi:hypothetical protein
MQNDLANVEQRIKRYWYRDGIGELVGGGMFVLMGGYFAVQEFLGENSTLTGILQVSLALILIAGMFAARRLINLLKTRLTYPRTGYVEYRVNERGLRMRRILAAGLGLVIAALVIMQAKSAGLIRFYVLGAVSLAMGLLLSLSGLPEGYSLGLFYGLMGLSFMVSGGLTLRGYLKDNPLPLDAESQHG